MEQADTATHTESCTFPYLERTGLDATTSSQIPILGSDLTDAEDEMGQGVMLEQDAVMEMGPGRVDS